MPNEQPQSPSAETALAVLGVKIDAMKVEASAMNMAINAKLDGVHMLVSEKVTNIEKRVTGIEEDVDKTVSRVTNLENDSSKLGGMRTLAVSLITIAIGIAGTALGYYADHIFK